MMGKSRLSPIDFSPILKHTGIKLSLVPRLYPRTQTNYNVKRDGVCQTASARPARRRQPGVVCQGRLPEGVWQAVCQATSARCRICQLPSARQRLPDAASARYRLPDGHGRRRLADGLSDATCQGRLVDGAWQTPSSRRPWQTASGRRPVGRRLPDAAYQGRLADGVWQMASGRRRLADGAWQTRHLADVICQTPCLPRPSGRWRLADVESARRRLADGLGRRCLADGVWQTASGRRQLMGKSRLSPIDFSPIIKHTGIKPSLVPRLYPRSQTNCNVKRNGVCQTASARPARQHLSDSLGRHGVWQTMPDAVSQASSAKAVCQTPHLPDAVCQTALADGVWQTVCQTPPAKVVWQTRRLADAICQTPSSRRPWRTPSDRRPVGRRLPDAAYQGRLADAAWQTASARRRVCQGHLADGAWQTWSLPDGVWQTALSDGS